VSRPLDKCYELGFEYESTRIDYEIIFVRYCITKRFFSKAQDMLTKLRGKIDGFLNQKELNVFRNYRKTVDSLMRFIESNGNAGP